MWSAPEDFLLRLQHTRSGALLRKEFEARKSFLYEQEEQVVKIQVCDSPATSYSKLFCPLRNVFFDNRTIDCQHSNKQIWLQIFFLNQCPQGCFLKAPGWEGCWMTSHLWFSREYSGAPWIPQVHLVRARANLRSDLKSCFSEQLDLLVSPTLLSRFPDELFFLVFSGCWVASEKNRRTNEIDLASPSVPSPLYNLSFFL